MQHLFYQQMLGNNWPATEKMLLLIQLPALGNEEAVHALFYLVGLSTKFVRIKMLKMNFEENAFHYTNHCCG